MNITERIDAAIGWFDPTQVVNRKELASVLKAVLVEPPPQPVDADPLSDATANLVEAALAWDNAYSKSAISYVEARSALHNAVTNYSKAKG